MRRTANQSKVPDLADLMLEALSRMEAKAEFSADDAVYLEFRQNVLRIIAELQVVRSLDDPALTPNVPLVTDPEALVNGADPKH